jgi:hypothetical protein
MPSAVPHTFNSSFIANQVLLHLFEAFWRRHPDSGGRSTDQVHWRHYGTQCEGAVYIGVLLEKSFPAVYLSSVGTVGPLASIADEYT